VQVLGDGLARDGVAPDELDEELARFYSARLLHLRRVDAVESVADSGEFERVAVENFDGRFEEMVCHSSDHSGSHKNDAAEEPQLKRAGKIRAS
jgi:hypothetical protein